MLPAIARARAELGPDSRSAKYTFFKWMATRPPYEAPSAEQLLDFSLDGTCPRGAFNLQQRGADRNQLLRRRCLGSGRAARYAGLRT